MDQKVQRIAVLKGGWSREREVSLVSGRDIAKALVNKGYDVCEIDVTQDIPAFIQELIGFNPDVVMMNSIHGRWAEDGCLQGLLEMLGYPYTNSGVLGSALAMDKDYARRIFQSIGVPVPKGECFEVSQLGAAAPYPYPFVMKAVNEGSSVDVHILHTEQDYTKALAACQHLDRVLIEDYIPGRELSVAVMGDRALGVLELEPLEGFYDYESKYTDGKTKHHMPARILGIDYQKAMDLSVKAALALGCQGVSRVDLRYDDVRGETPQMYVLEVNTQPGMTPLSIVPEIAQHAGISFEQLLEWMIQNPRCPERNQVTQAQSATIKAPTQKAS